MLFIVTECYFKGIQYVNQSILNVVCASKKTHFDKPIIGYGETAEDIKSEVEADCFST